MLQKKLLLWVIYLTSINSFAQVKQFQLTESSNGRGISFAYVANLSKKIYTITDENGRFEIQISEGDSIQLKHLSFQKKIFLYREGFNWEMQIKSIDLEELEIKPIKGKQKLIGNKLEKKSTVYGWAANSPYAISITNDSKRKIEFVKIPFKFKKGYEWADAIRVYIATSQGNDIFPVSSEKILKVNQLKNKGEFVVDFSVDKVFVGDENFFVVVEPLLTHKQLPINIRSISVNPFLFCSKTTELNSSFWKPITSKQDKWFSLSEWQNNFNWKVALSVESIEY